MSAQPERAGEEAVAPEHRELVPQAQPRASARGGTASTALLLEPVKPPRGDGESPAEQALNRAIGAFGQVDRLYKRAAHGHSLLHLDPPSVQSVWAGHRKAAARWDGALLRGLRLTYGVLHTAITVPVYIILWATSTPAGLVITAVLLTAAAVWL